MLDFSRDAEQSAANITGYANYRKGQSISRDYIGKLIVEGNGTIRKHLFSIKSTTYYDKHYKVIIITDEDKITNGGCTCPEYRSRHSCKHIAAVILNFYKEIIDFTFDPKDVSNEIIDDLFPFKERRIRKQLNFTIEIEFGDRIFPKLKIGDNKLYSLNNKFSSFIDSYNEEELVFGKEFTYDPELHYFSKQDEKIIEFLIKKYKMQRYNYYNNYLYFEIDELNSFLDLLGDKEFIITNIGSTKNYIVGNPYEIKLTHKDDGYIFKVDFKSAKRLDDEYKYAYLDRLYSIPETLSNLYSRMDEYKIDELYLTEDYIIRLTKNIYNLIEEKLAIDSDIKEKIVVKRPTVKMYFDFKECIMCNLIFDYNGKEVNYFENQVANRDEEYELEILKELLHYQFVIEESNLFIKNMDEIVAFLETGIFELTEKYNVFTTQKIKNADIIKNNSITSHFSIGRDNIMSYQFDLGNIDSSELNKIFDSMKNKKHYYKLKSGKILDIEDEQLKQLQDLIENLDIDTKNSNGVIPKYRAIYLDSIDYSIIKTDNLFKEFVNNFNLYKGVDIALSKKDEKILRDYQKDGVKWLYNLYKCGFGGILADEMGLGKSIQTIMFIKELIKENIDTKILIVAPTSLIYNWQHEFDMFGSELKYKVIAENKDKRLETLSNFNDNNIFITTYGLVRQDQDNYLDKTFDVIIIDEAQNIKNPKAGISKVVKELNSISKFALTGTPVENSILELWSIFDFIMPGYLNNLSKFQTKFNIKDIDEDGRNKLKSLSKVVTPFIFRRKKKDVLFDLPDKIENNIYLELLPEQKKIYAAQVKKTQQEFEELLKTEGFLKARFKILQLLTKLRQICIDPSIVFENYKNGSVKIDEVINLINNSILNGHKILLFTSFKTALEIVKQKLEENNIKYYVIDGSVSSKMRNQLVTSFNKDDTKVFLITLKSGGTGLNLTSADIVIHLDLWWNPQVENQATDRAHRIGQKNTVEVVKFICKGTIEEKIIELQNKKKILVETLIDDENKDENIISKLNEKDIIELLSFTE